MMERLKRWAQAVKRDLLALWLSVRDPRVPLHAKALAAGVTAYAFSPIDLIPDFVPVLGYLDDILLVPLGIWCAVKLIPTPVMAELRERARNERKPTSRAGLVGILFLWAAILTASLWAVSPLL
jgi:uncharacterized membrane protein YkvA (DUF1232 family)